MPCWRRPLSTPLLHFDYECAFYSMWTLLLCCEASLEFVCLFLVSDIVSEGQLSHIHMITSATRGAALGWGENNEAQGSSSCHRIEGDDAAYFLVPFGDMGKLMLSVDLGWVGIENDELEACTTTHDGKRVVLIAVVSPGVAVGYGLFLGAPQSKSSIRDAVRRDLPGDWAMIVRVGWLRAGAVCRSDVEDLMSPTGAASGSDDERCTKKRRLEEATHSCTELCRVSKGALVKRWRNIDATTGKVLCQAIDEMSVTVLPHELRAHYFTTVAHQPSSEMPPSGPHLEHSRSAATAALTIDYYRSYLRAHYPNLSPHDLDLYAHQYYTAQLTESLRSGASNR